MGVSAEVLGEATRNGELEWAESLGVDKDLVRVSVGLEDEAEMRKVFKGALDVARNVKIGEEEK